MCACMCVCPGITDLHVLHADSLARACDAAVCSECKSVCWVESASMERVMSSSKRQRLMMMMMMDDDDDKEKVKEGKKRRNKR